MRAPQDLRTPAVGAASLLLVRPGADGEAEVFALRRAGTMAFSAHATAFPGGRVDPADELDPALWEGVDLDAWARRLGLPGEPDGALSELAALPPRRAAGRVLAATVRETFEETGLVLDPAAVLPCGYERFTPVPGEGAAFHVTLPLEAPVPAPELDRTP